MVNILIIGGYGYTGKALAPHLLRETDAGIVLGGRHLDKATSLADSLNAQFSGNRVSAACVDAADRRSLEAALSGNDLLVVAAPTTQYAENVIRTALDCGVDYLDIQLGAGKLRLLQSLSDEIERRGLCFITEAGFHPGLPSAMIRFAAAGLERLDTALTAGYLNMGSSLPYTEAVDELMELFLDYQAQVYKNNAWTKPRSYELRKFDFGEGIGVRQCYSMFFEELRLIPEMYPSLRETGFYISSSHWLLDWVIFPVAMAGLKISPRRLTRPVGRLVWWGMQNLPRPPYQVLLKVEVKGEKGGKPARFEASVCHADGYELTAIPVAATLLQVLDGSVRRPGLWMMGQLVQPDRLFADMRRMGVEVKVWQP